MSAGGRSARRQGRDGRDGGEGRELREGPGRRERPSRRGGLWRLLGRQDPAAGGADLAASSPHEPHCTRIRDCAEGPAGRPVVSVSGTLRSVREKTVAGMPAIHAELDDGSAALDVVWLGRRAIAGIEPGRALVASGRIAVTHGRPVLFNPRYQLQPREQE